jgi:hypothetical protein
MPDVHRSTQACVIVQDARSRNLAVLTASGGWYDSTVLGHRRRPDALTFRTEYHHQGGMRVAAAFIRTAVMAFRNGGSPIELHANT